MPPSKGVATPALQFGGNEPAPPPLMTTTQVPSEAKASLHESPGVS